jgi:hypothetical protein
MRQIGIVDVAEGVVDRRRCRRSERETEQRRGAQEEGVETHRCS